MNCKGIPKTLYWAISHSEPKKTQKAFTIQLDFICLHKPFSGNQEREGESLKPTLFFISNRSPDVLWEGDPKGVTKPANRNPWWTWFGLENILGFPSHFTFITLPLHEFDETQLWFAGLCVHPGLQESKERLCIED